MWGSRLNPSVRWVHLVLLGAVTIFVGAMWGLERTVVPLIAKNEFGIASATVTLSFIFGFGLTKCFANLVGGGLMDRIGRRGVLVVGWVVGLPVPLLIIWAPAWEWVVAANLLLGVNQGLCWTATILMMMDRMGPQRRGLSVGLNEFAGYSGVAIATLATGFVAGAFAPRPHPFLFGTGVAVVGLLLSAFLVQETGRHVRDEATEGQARHRPPSFRGALIASLRDRSLLSCSQGGLVTKINDAAIWGLLPLFLATQGLGVARISVVAAIYPAAWGITQLFTGSLSDRVGRKPLIVLGMLVQSLGMSLVAVGIDFSLWIGGVVVLGLGTALVYPTLIAAVGDYAHPLRRASSVGIYRWYRDAGFMVGALLAGAVADLLGFRATFFLIGGISLLSALVVWLLMQTPAVARGGTRRPAEREST